MFINTKTPSTAEDTWAIGMIIYEILTNHRAYQGKDENQIKNDIINGIIPEFPETTEENEKIIVIIQMCLNPNPQKGHVLMKFCINCSILIENFSQMLMKRNSLIIL